MSVLNQSGEEQVECPLCMEPLEVDDLNFYPCTCGYQICRFCWHRIRTDENGLCPACRKAYSENPADFTPLSKEQVAQLKAEKRAREHQRKAKISESRKHLAAVRVVQKNLVFVVGLPVRLADADVLKKHEYFGKFGKIHKVVINQSTSYAGSQGPSASAYVTYVKSDDALRAIQSVNNIMLDGRLIKSSLGTTKYCSHFMKNQPCPKADCMYLHDFGDPEASFTKEQMHIGKHQEYEKKLHDSLQTRTQQQLALAQQQSQQQQNQQQQNGSQNQSQSNTATTADKEKDKNGGQKGKDWPTLHGELNIAAFGNSKSDKQKSESKSEKAQKKNQKNKNINNNTNSTNNNIDSTKQKNDKEKTNSSKNCEQSCTVTSQLPTQTLHTNQESIEIPTTQHQNPQLANSPVATEKLKQDALEAKPSNLSNLPANLSNLSNLPGNITSNLSSSSATTDCIENLTKMQIIDDNSSFFSNNSFQKLLPEESSSYSTESSRATPHSNILNDSLPDITSSEDWAAAFGFPTLKPEPPRTVIQENGFPQTDFTLNRTENGFVNHLENFQKNQQNYDLLKTRENLLDVLGRNSHFLSSNYNKIEQNERLNHSNTNQFIHKPENGLTNGLDQQMSKFFAEFSNKNGYNHQNGFVDRQNFVGNNQISLNENQHNMLLINYQQRLLDKQIEDQALFNLKQNVFHNQQQQNNQQQNIQQQNMQQQNIQQQQHQQQYMHNHGIHHSGSQQFLANGGEHFLNQNGQSFGNSGFTQNTVFQNQQQALQQQRNLQQQLRAGERANVDDDLGFDPFHETQKALAELIESEQGVQQIQNNGLLGTGSGPSSANSNNVANAGGPPVNGLIGGGASHLPPPPPGFMQHNTHMNSFGLAPVNDWMTLDPAIVSSSRHFPIASLPLRDQFPQNIFQQSQNRGAPFEYPNNHTNGYTPQNPAHIPTYANTYNHNHTHTQSNGLNWFAGDIQGVSVSSPPGFRPASKTQEC